ncbi:putative nitrilase [Poronia punctata]|nr:putative nitrilase [Poronia punctata]
MATTTSSLRIAVTQAEPEWLNLTATVEKTIKLIEEAASNGARLIAFPEVWITGYPGWIWSRPLDPALTTKYTLNALRVPSPEMDLLLAAAHEHDTAVVFGFAERTPTDSLYISQAIISPQGRLLLKRRKIKPTHVERTVFGDGSGPDLDNVVDVDFGGDIGTIKIGTLACWEHAQPLLKYHAYTQGEAIHIAMWPPLYPHGGAAHWALSAEGCLALSQTYAVEGAKFVLHCTAVASQDAVDSLQTQDSFVFNKPGGGQSCVIAPDGRRLTAPLEGDGNSNGNGTTEGIVYADLLWLGVDKKAKEPIM